MTGGLSAQVVAVAAAAASALVLTSADTSSTRLARLSRRSAARKPPAASLEEAAAPSSSNGSRRRLVAVAVAGASVAVTLGGGLGVVLGVLAAVGGYLALGRLEPRTVRQRREQVARDLPAAASLLGAAVSAGATPVAAIEVVAMAVGGPLGDDLQRLAASARLGGDLMAGSNVSGAGAPVAPLVRVITRSVHTGAPLAAALDRLAADLQAQRRLQVERRARSVGVRAAAPLGLCFLPGFLLVGVVPVVAGIASTVLGFAL